MLEIAVIADDLTGAADTGVQFCPYFDKTVLTSYQGISSPHATTGHDGLAIYTNSRPLKADEARERLTHMARQLSRLEPKRIYKKVDSSVRGNIGAEVDAIADAMGFDWSFIAPAFPDMGRTTLHDIHRIHGTPVAQTELSKDPVTPVRESRLSRIISAQSIYRVKHVDLDSMSKDDEALLEDIRKEAEGGVRHFVFDVMENNHLDKIARMAVRSPKEILLVGSAGLAWGLAGQLPRGRTREGPEQRDLPEGHHLLVCGTVSERTRMQIAELKANYHHEAILLRPEILADPSRMDQLITESSVAQRILWGHDLIIQVVHPETGDSSYGEAQSLDAAQAIVDGLGLLVATIVKNTKPASLFLSGGDTANAVLDAIDAKGIHLRREIVPGVPFGTLLGGLMKGHPVITKAGAFGEKDTLVAVHKFLLNNTKEVS